MRHLVLAITLCLALGVAGAFSPREGAEVLIVDPSGQQILGHGQILEGRLFLSLSPDTTQFRLLLVHADGSIETFDGRREGLDGLEIEMEPDRYWSLDSVLAEAGVVLTVVLAERPPVAGERDSVETAGDGLPIPGGAVPDPSVLPPLPALPVSPPGNPTVSPPVGGDAGNAGNSGNAGRPGQREGPDRRQREGPDRRQREGPDRRQRDEGRP